MKINLKNTNIDYSQNKLEKIVSIAKKGFETAKQENIYQTLGNGCLDYGNVIGRKVWIIRENTVWKVSLFPSQAIVEVFKSEF